MRASKSNGGERMQTVLFVGQMATGDEVDVRRVHERFPVEALERGIGVERLVAFIGSGYYALELTVSGDEFQDAFHRFLGAPEVQELFQALRPYVRDLPSPDQTTAYIPLATAMHLWQRPRTDDATTV